MYKSNILNSYFVLESGIMMKIIFYWSIYCHICKGKCKKVQRYRVVTITHKTSKVNRLKDYLLTDEEAPIFR